MTTGSDSILIQGLSKTYLEGAHQRQVLNNVSAEFEVGKVHAVVGRSGSGKSTLLNLIAGIDLPDAGLIQVAGLNITDFDERRRTLLRRQHIGIIFQFFNLITSLTVAENVRLPLELNGQSNSAQRARQALDRVGLGDRSDSFPMVLSGGEQQRVAIARAIVHQPSIILADEPTGNLDETAAAQVFLTLTNTRGGSTVIIVTHSVELAKQCDYQWHLHSGQLQLC